jgi:hypothetical protein
LHGQKKRSAGKKRFPKKHLKKNLPLRQHMEKNVSQKNVSDKKNTATKQIMHRLKKRVIWTTNRPANPSFFPNP